MRAGERADVARQVHGAQAHASPPRRRGRRANGVAAVAEARRAREHRLPLRSTVSVTVETLFSVKTSFEGFLATAKVDFRASTGGWRR